MILWFYDFHTVYLCLFLKDLKKINLQACTNMYILSLFFLFEYQQYQTATLLCDVFKEIITVHQ